MLSLASRFNFLDRGFAEYFNSVVPSFDRTYVRERLQNARQAIVKGQTPDPTKVEDPEHVYLGDLGEFCENLSKTWDAEQPTEANAEYPIFNNTHRRDREIFEYLQDAFEVPYWELILDVFLQWRASSESLSGKTVFIVLKSLGGEIETARSRLLSEIEMQTEDRREDLDPILQGIDARIEVLGTVWDMNAFSTPEVKEQMTRSVQPQQLQLHHDQSEYAEEPLEVGARVVLRKEKESVGLIALIFLFLTAAIVPGYKAYSISKNSGARGSVHDADFWYLIQSSIMSVLGNLIMVVPLLKKSWFSPAYSVMWIFFALGVTLAIISIIIYPFTNTGWSSILAFFASIASVASVLVMTLAAAKDVPRKIKDE